MTATIEERVTSLEVRMDEQERLRASQDLDLAGVNEKLRAQDTLLKAIRKTQSEDGQTLRQLSGRVDQLTGRVDQLSGRVDQLSGRVDQLDGRVEQLTGTVTELKGGVTQIVGMLTTLIERDGRQ
jgi:chromosome segregation ATPase